MGFSACNLVSGSYGSCDLGVMFVIDVLMPAALSEKYKT